MSEPMQQQSRRGGAVLPGLQVMLQCEVHAHEFEGVQVITTCSEPSKIGWHNIICAVPPQHLPDDIQRIIASNIEYALNWERGHR